MLEFYGKIIAIEYNLDKCYKSNFIIQMYTTSQDIEKWQNYRNN